MVETQGRLTEEQQRRHVETSHARGHDSGALDNGPGKLSHTLGLVSHESLSARANTTTRATTLGAMQQTYGNRAVQRYLHAAVPTSSRPTSISVQREEEGGIWDWTKKLIGVDQIGPSIEKAAGKAKSGYNWAEKKLFNLLGGGGGPGETAPAENAPPAPNSDFPSQPYYKYELENTFITSYS